MNFYQWHIGDYMSHTRHLSPMEDLAFRRMLDEYYLHERPLNGRSSDVARSIGMRDHVEEVEAVLREFFTETSSGWANTRAEAEIEQYREKQQKASEAGKASGRARAKKAARERMLNDRSADDEPTSTMNQEPLPVPQEPEMEGCQDEGFSSSQQNGVPVPPSTRTGESTAGAEAAAVLNGMRRPETWPGSTNSRQGTTDSRERRSSSRRRPAASRGGAA